MSSFALGPLSNRPPQYQNQYTLVNKNGWLRLAAVSRRALALPPEILGEIFLCCLPESDFTAIHLRELPITPRPNQPPLVFCAVCRQWRDIALATPRLWGSLDINSNFAHSDAGASYVEFCQRWISRAGATPLSFSFEDYDVEHRSTRLLHNLLGGLHQQWRCVELLRDSSVPNWLQLPSKGKYPVLEQLTIGEVESDPSVLSFCNAPRLRIACLLEYTPQIQLPWHQLTSFRTYTIEASACLKILRASLNLVHCFFGRIEDDYSLQLSKLFVSLGHLRSLKVSREWEEDTVGVGPMNVLASLKAPALEILTLEFNYEPRALPISPLFLSFISRSACKLHTLALHRFPVRGTDLITCLRATPSLVHLKLLPLPSVRANILFGRLTGDLTLLPMLESFYLVFPESGIRDVTSSTAEWILEMLCWRRRTTPLHSFSLSHAYDQSVFENTLINSPEFRRLQTEGMSLSIKKWWYSESFMWH
ncbi:hypothetical protein C8F04DRAFT_1063071 [Mycena alexandri]|uniref:F-box domain-containing protein n=1 Tax=Mycena alexandri TaxID=1745969 RepID=A0AAD6TIG8_9AGAR|nr:hypothetical protein C8F04DRAFT_1063071 [Mycena alexandri]